jgi:PAS domain-containing protein
VAGRGGEGPASLAPRSVAWLRDSFGEGATYRVIGEPMSLPDAAALAKADPYQFQFWALGLVGARPVQEKKGADQGVDGRIYFHDEKGQTKLVVLSVKAAHTNPSRVRDLRGVAEREKAALGVLITMQERARLATLLLSMDEAVFVVDRTGAVALTNTAVERLLGPEGADFVPQDEDGRPLPTEETPRAHAARGESFSMTFTLPGPDGTRRRFEATGQPI